MINAVECKLQQKIRNPDPRDESKPKCPSTKCSLLSCCQDVSRRQEKEITKCDSYRQNCELTRKRIIMNPAYFLLLTLYTIITRLEWTNTRAQFHGQDSKLTAI